MTKRVVEYVTKATPDVTADRVQDEFGELRENLYLVRETKGSTDPDERRGTENMRIACARKHFALLDVDYDDVTTGEEFRRKLLATPSP